MHFLFNIFFRNMLQFFNMFGSLECMWVTQKKHINEGL